MSTKNPFHCLIIDDDASFAAMLVKIIGEQGGQTTCCGDLKSARIEAGRQSFEWVILDERLPDGTGYEFYSQLNGLCPGAIVVMITGAPELSKAVALTRNGLFDYLTKPLNVADFNACMERVLKRLDHPDRPKAAEMIGTAPAVREVLTALRQAARHQEAIVLLTGETGTGKDLAARLLHQMTYPERSTAPYVPVNCSAVPAEIFEAELFGSEKGAFTGADRRREGLVESASGGTLFLDEITEAPLPQQSKLLRFLESREYRSLGSNKLRAFNGRIVAASNRSLEEEVKRGHFREDLMFRLTVATVHLPALREHISDLEMLAENVLVQLCDKYRRAKPRLKPGDLEALKQYHFPGNVRELRNLLERGLLRTPDDSATLAFDLGWLSTAANSRAAAGVSSSLPPLPAGRELNSLEQQEYRMVQQALLSEGGGIRRAATRLGITHQALLRRLEKWPELRQAAARSN